MNSEKNHGPMALLVSESGKQMPQGFAKVPNDPLPKIAPLSRAAKFFGLTRKSLYSMLFSPVHPTPDGVVWKFRGRHLVDIQLCERWLRGKSDETK